MVKIHITKIIPYFIEIIALICIVAILFCYDVYIVSSSSMEDTLYCGDVVLVKNRSKNYSGLFQSDRDTRQIRAKVVVFKSSYLDSPKHLIKRCIGISGDTLTFRNNGIRVNSNTLQDHASIKYGVFSFNVKKIPLKEYCDSCNINFIIFEDDIYRINATNDCINDLRSKGIIDSVIYAEDPFISQYHNFTIVIPKADDPKFYFSGISYGNLYSQNELSPDYILNNYYFFAGDNRSNSIDSRKTGVVPENLIVGIAKRIIISINREASGIAKIRFNRILKKIE